MLKRLNFLPKRSSREQIAIKEVRDNVLVLPHGYYAAVVETSSVNFELKSETEQDLILERFSHFINALPTSIQILVRVRELAIDDYIASIHQNMQSETDAKYKEQAEAYCEFVKSLVSGNKIMSRRFYIVVPYKSNSSQQSVIQEELAMYTDIVVKGLEKMNMKATRLASMELLELFYELYNPHSAKMQKLQVLTSERFIKNFYAI